MHQVEPTVRLIGSSFIDETELIDYLESVGAPDWAPTPEIDQLSYLTEVMGRLCYRSWAPGLNPNVTRVRTESAAYIDNLIDSGHGSVMEHATTHWIFQDVSRVFTHELVRHRVGTAMSQESQRYVRLDDLPLWFPPAITEMEPKDLEEFTADVGDIMRLMEGLNGKWVRRLKLDEQGTSFGWKKLVTSALRRYFSPTGVATAIGWTCNVRELRHVIQLRTDVSAEEEMRDVFSSVADICSRTWPLLFADITQQADGSWKRA